MVDVTLATLNIASASKERAQRILDEWILPNGFDVYVLTETSEGSGTQHIVSELRTAGWKIFQRPTLTKDRGVAVASRVAATESAHRVDDPAPGRAMVIDLETSPPIQIVGMYVPNRGNDPLKLSRKKSYLERWLTFLADSFPSRHARVLLGDLNVVPSGHWPRFLPQQQFEYDWYENLDRRGGLYDAAKIHTPGGHESTWVAHTGEGYTYDHIMLEKNLSGRVKAFLYDHSTRIPSGLSDHSALVIKIEFDSVNKHQPEPIDRAQPTLFDF